MLPGMGSMPYLNFWSFNYMGKSIFALQQSLAWSIQTRSKWVSTLKVNQWIYSTHFFNP